MVTRIYELFDVDLENGILRRKSGRGMGKRAGYVMKGGYRAVCIDYKDYFEHNLIWLLVHCAWPPNGKEVDHKNLKRDDNRPTNLRLATRSQNNANMRVRADNELGVRGVSYVPRRNKYLANVTVNGVRVLTKRYNTIEEAEAAVKAVRHEHWGEFNFQGD